MYLPPQFIELLILNVTKIFEKWNFVHRVQLPFLKPIPISFPSPVSQKISQSWEIVGYTFDTSCWVFFFRLPGFLDKTKNIAFTKARTRGKEIIGNKKGNGKVGL